jgi:Transglycosylase SLT domain
VLLGVSLFTPTQVVIAANLDLIAQEHGIPSSVFLHIAHCESHLNPSALNPNDGGTPSYGLFQFKKSTFYGYGGTEAVLSAFRRRERFTNLELARFLEWEINTVTPRVNELVKKGVLEEHCKRECEISGRTATCWQIKAVGQLGLL